MHLAALVLTLQLLHWLWLSSQLAHQHKHVRKPSPSTTTMRKVLFVDKRFAPDVSTRLTMQSLEPKADVAGVKLRTPAAEIAGATEKSPAGELLQLTLKAKVSDSPGPAEMLVAHVAL
jgi:hypothetical protein